MYKKIIPYINTSNELKTNVLSLAENYYYSGADELFLYDYSEDEESRADFLALAKELSKMIDIPFILGIYAERFEDIKKALYTGASKVMVKQKLLQDKSFIKEASERFGKDKLILELENADDIKDKVFAKDMEELGFYGIMLKHINISDTLSEKIQEFPLSVMVRDSLSHNDISEILKLENVEAVMTNAYEGKELMPVKNMLKEQKIATNTFESSLSFDDFKLNSDGLIPVVVQDYKTADVLMVAYMNEEAFHSTLVTGKMTYYSRSRKELWQKGRTSGHFQYVKELRIDCDNDTLLAKVHQIGAACHTGNQSCFYTRLAKKEYDDTNPLTVLNEVYQVIMDRKEHPKSGSYTNYLFDKGIDKILKKCGEEATEIVIAAKNPDAEELKYEISDFLYHMMVLMAECGLDWNDIIKELAHRR